MIPLAHHPIRVSLAVGRRGRRPVRRLCRLTGPQPEVRPGTLDRLAARLPGQVSTPGDDGYAAAMAIGRDRPGACRTPSSTARRPSASEDRRCQRERRHRHRHLVQQGTNLGGIVDLLAGQLAATIWPVTASTPRCSFRYDRRVRLPCFLDEPFARTA
jgi:hypothetical protein